MPNTSVTTTTKRSEFGSGTTYYGTGIKKASKALSTSYFDNSIVLSICSALPQNARTGNSVYDYKNGMKIYLKPKSARTLVDLIKRARSVIADAEDFKSLSVNSGGNLITVSTGEEHGLPRAVTITIYTNIKEDKTCETYEAFQFNSDMIIVGYDNTTGTYGESAIGTDLTRFSEQLLEFSKAESNALPYFVRKEAAPSISKITMQFSAIAEKLGLPVDYQQSKKTNRFGSSSFSSYNNGDTSTSELMDELDSLS